MLILMILLEDNYLSAAMPIGQVSFNPLNLKINICILICHPYSFPTSWGEVDKLSSKFIMCDLVRNSHLHSVLCTKHQYYKEKFDADHS